MKLSYEGEGIYLGIKTLFLNDNILWPDQKQFSNRGIKINNLYINTNAATEYLYNYINDWLAQGKDKKITIETEIIFPKKYFDLEKLMFCLSVKTYAAFIKNFRKNKDFLKIRILDYKDLESSIEIANKYVENNFKVLLMPEFEHAKLGELMLQYFDDVHPQVRFMPPVQDLLKIN